jgi:hypothetical protein
MPELISDPTKPSRCQSQEHPQGCGCHDGPDDFPATPGWQPIATAPKDGTRIAVAAYDGEVWQFRTDYWRDYWRGQGQGFGWIGVEPTHWMSLPEPPMPLPPAPASEHKSSALGQPAVRVGDGLATDWRHKSATEDRFNSDKSPTAAVGDESVTGARRFLDQTATAETPIVVADVKYHIAPSANGEHWLIEDTEHWMRYLRHDRVWVQCGAWDGNSLDDFKFATESAARAFAEQAAQENRT